MRSCKEYEISWDPNQTVLRDWFSIWVEKKCKKLGRLDSFVSGLLTFTKCGREYHRSFKNNLNTVETEKQENVRNVWERQLGKLAEDIPGKKNQGQMVESLWRNLKFIWGHEEPESMFECERAQFYLCFRKVSLTVVWTVDCIDEMQPGCGIFSKPYWETWIWSDRQWEPLTKFLKRKRHGDSGVLSFKIKLKVIYKTD